MDEIREQLNETSRELKELNELLREVIQIMKAVLAVDEVATLAPPEVPVYYGGDREA